MAYVDMNVGLEAKYTETSLWTNSAPTSNFAAQTVSLSDSISNYKYIGIKYKFVTTGTSSTMAVYPVDLLKQSVNGGGTDHLETFMGIQIADNSMYARQIYYASETSIGFSANTRLGNTQSYVNSAIPLEILGLNELDHGKRFDETTLWTNNVPTSAFANQTITLSDDIDNYDYIAITYMYNSSTNIQNKVVYNVSDFKSLLLANNQKHTTASLSMQDSSNNTYCRPFGYVSNTSIKFELCYRLMSNSYTGDGCIPLSVIGCKFR